MDTKKTADPDLARPLRMGAANFTPQQRTPWGGTRIVSELKSGLVSAMSRSALLGSALLGSTPGGKTRVGESWEISSGPEFPSDVVGFGPLSRLVETAGHALLGQDRGRGFQLLMKLLDAEQPLSLQIHPGDQDPALAPGECGKWEAWYVIDADPGAALYLGFRHGVSRTDVETVLAQGGDLSPLMHRMEVAGGEFVLVRPGTPHAVGAGVLLAEPQRVQPGKRGVTYRYWDWNRTYNDAGDLAPDGKGRTLHVKRALDVTDWNRAREEALEEQTVRRISLPVDAPLQLRCLASNLGMGDVGRPNPQRSGQEVPGGPVHNGALWVSVVAGTGNMSFDGQKRLVGGTLLSGTLEVHGPFGVEHFQAGESFLLPAVLGPVDLVGTRAHLLLSRPL